MAKVRAEWHTPKAVMKNKEEVWAKLDKHSWAPPPVRLSPEIAYFENPIKHESMQEYDRFFAYTKIFPLWDPRKKKDNTQYSCDIHRNILEQEKNKCVPALTSHNYGRACRPPLDISEKSFNRARAIGDFYRRRGVTKPIERKVI